MPDSDAASVVAPSWRCSSARVASAKSRREHVYSAMRDEIAIDESRLMADEVCVYREIDRSFRDDHETVCHKRGEYARKPDVTTNGIEGIVGLLQRASYGGYHHIDAKHLHRYLGEREFAFNRRNMTDDERVAEAVRAAKGNRLRYREQAGAPT